MRKIALVGTAPSSTAAPVDDPSYEIWGVSSRAAHITRADRWFELHRLDGEPPEWANEWRRQLRSWIDETPLVMFYPEPNLAKNIWPYPFEKIKERFGTFFMTSTFSWMMAMAIDELRPTRFSKGKNDEIFICGVEMEAGSEYEQQRAGFRHMIQLAAELGITVTRLGEGGLSYEPIPYPMWQDDPLLCKLTLRKSETQSHLAELDKTIRAIHLARADANGQIAGIRNATEGTELSPAMTQQLQSLHKAVMDLNEEAARVSKSIVGHEGAMEQIQWTIDYLQP